MSDPTEEDPAIPAATGSNEAPSTSATASAPPSCPWDSSRLRVRRTERLSALIARKWCGVSEALSGSDEEKTQDKDSNENSGEIYKSPVGYKMALRSMKRRLGKRAAGSSNKNAKRSKLPSPAESSRKSQRLSAKNDSKTSEHEDFSEVDSPHSAVKRRGRSSTKNDSKISEHEDFSEPDSPPRALKKRGRPKKKSIEVSSSLETEDSLPAEEQPANLDHIQKLEGEEKYQCTICTKKFRNQATIENHEICKVNEKFYACEYCHQKPLRKVEYEQHLKTHTGREHFICHICSDWFLKRSKWHYHVLLHEGRSHFFCKPCEKKFPYFKRKIHVRSHAGAHQFACQRCKEDFIVNIIENEPPEQDNQPAGICTYCGKKFGTKFQFYTHFLTEAKCNYNCDQCTSLRVQKMAPFKCRKCKAKFTKRRNLENHRKSVHPPVKPKGGMAKKKKPVDSNKEETVEKQLDAEINEEKTDQISDSVEEISPTEDQVTELCEIPPLEEVKEPCDPVSTIKIRLDQFTVLEFERVATTKTKWQQTNPNNTEFMQEHDFCSQCQIPFDVSSFHVVNTNCGHLLCMKCFESDAVGCLLCDEVDDDESLQFLTTNEKDMLTRVKDIVKQLVSVRFKTDADEIEKTIFAKSEVKKPGEPVVLSCIRGPLEKNVSTKSVQFP